MHHLLEEVLATWDDTLSGDVTVSRQHAFHAHVTCRHDECPLHSSQSSGELVHLIEGQCTRPWAWLDGNFFKRFLLEYAGLKCMKYDFIVEQK